MSTSKKPWIVRGAAAAGCVVVLWYWPLFHVVHLDQSTRESSDAEADAFVPAAFVETFWTERLLPADSRAVDARELVSLIRADRKDARNAHGRSVGLSSTYYYFVSGTGRVTRVDRQSIGLAVDPEIDDVQVLLETGPIFGNAIRDGTGLLDVNDYANSRDFNAISSEINRRIESEVLPPLREAAKVGSTVRFVGCAEVADEAADLGPLRVVPIIAEAQ